MTGESPADTVMFTPFVGSDTQMLVVVTPALPLDTSSWVETVAGIPFKSFDTDASPLIGSVSRTTSDLAGGFDTQAMANGLAGPMKTVGVSTPQVGSHGSTSQSLGTSMPTPWWVTVFYPTGIGEEVGGRALFEGVAGVHAAEPTLHRITAPTNIRRTKGLLTHELRDSFPVEQAPGTTVCQT